MRLSRRDFMKHAGCVAAGLAAGVPAWGGEPPAKQLSRVVMIRRRDALRDDGTADDQAIRGMLDEAMAAFFEEADIAACWKRIIAPGDVVGIKSNVWHYLPTPDAVVKAVTRRVREAGVGAENIAADDRGVLRNPVFKRATALINTRPMRTHAWSGVGSLIKNYIMFDPEPPKYHPNSCASLAALWDLPAVKDKTRLNVLVMLTPQFHNLGPHHFDPEFIWPYRGLLVGTDPVAVDALGLRIIQAKRRLHFGSDRPIQPTAHHIAIADREYGLGCSRMEEIELIRLGWEDEALI
ncbi:MAG: DUF362 domain-containing protein [Candidatus Eisenbacteria bacterium]|nr:DUF362 domain-containing protein [Candidatus Eisenbacteria bacterium]